MDIRFTKLKNSKWLIVVSIFCMFLPTLMRAQVDVTASGGTASASYTTLKESFEAINAGTHSGIISIDISASTTETATAVLFASGVGGSSYSKITIVPSGGGARTISGAIAPGLPLIDLNGADNVLIDGLYSGGNSLTISNTTASGTSGTSTIRFIGGATSNTITNCFVFGSFSAAVGTNGGNIFFSTDANTANGNDNNVISYCNIGPAGSNFPTKGIYMNGSTSTTAINNSGNTILNNYIFDYFGAGVSSAGVYIAGGNTDINITNNRFYQTGPKTQTTGTQHSAIWITNTSGNNFQVTGNIIGYASSAQTGVYSFTGVSSSSVFIPIHFNVGTTTLSNASGNLIDKIVMTGTLSGTSSSASFRGIYVAAGLLACNTNTIGGLSSSGNIMFSSSSSSAADVIGILNWGSSNFTTNNNEIGGFTLSNSSTGATNFYGLRTNTGSGVTWACNNNVIGGSVTNSIDNTSTASGSIVNGILNSNPSGTFSNNIIRNMSAAGGTGTGSTASVAGIVISATSANHTVTANTIYNLSNSLSGASNVSGIIFSSSTGSNVIEKNLVYGLNAANVASVINGINILGGTATYKNNMIRLGVSGSSSTLGMQINGINETTAGTNNIWHNSVYIGGAPTTGSANTFAFQSSITTNTRSYQNNIFYNARSNNGSTGKNYAIRVGGTTVNPTGLTSNRNILFAPGTGGVVGLYNGIDRLVLSAWSTATGQDNSSYSADPAFIAPTATVPDLHINPSIPSFAEGFGTLIASVTDDFDSQSRTGLTPTDIGADAFNGTPVPACSGTPIAGTISLSNSSSTCSGSTVLSLSGQTSDLGIAVQWQSSTDNVTFSSIPSATTTAYTTPSLSSTTYYQAVVTCTNSSQTATTTAVAFSVTPVIAGTIAASSSSVCSGSNFTLTLSGNSTSGVSYQWQSSPDNTTWTSIPSATLANAVVSQTTATYYQAIVTCTSSATTAISTPIQVNMNTLLNCYCVTNPTTGGIGDIITNISVTNTAGQNLTQASTYTAPAYFVSYNNSPLNLIKGSTSNTLSITFGTDGTQHSAAWIDFNQNGVYETSENIALSSVSAGASATVNYSFSVPAGATSGLTRLRVRGGSDAAYTVGGACNSTTYGETEDYIVNIVPLPATPPAPTQSTVSPTCASGTELMVTGTPDPGDAWYWQTVSNGTSTLVPVSGNYTVNVNGTYFVRAYNSTNNLWSTNSSSIVVSNIPVAPLPPTPSVGASPACISTTLSVPTSTDVNVSYYWQGTNSTGTSTVSSGSSPFTVTVSGTYYVAAYDASTSCWSNTSGVPVTIETNVPPTPTTAISSVSVCEGASSATITASAQSVSSQSVVLGSSVSLPGSGSVVLTNTITVPAGAVISSTKLVFNGVTTTSATYPNDIKAALSGAITMSATTISTVNAVVSNAGPYNLNTPNISSSGGVLTLTLTNGWTGAASFGNVSLVFTYAMPHQINWWDAPTAGVLQSTVTPLETVGTTLLPNTNTAGTYTFFAESKSGVCSSSSRLPITVNVLTTPAMPTTANSSQCGFAVPSASVSGGSVYNWYTASTGGSLLQSGTSQTYTSSISNTTTFYVAISNGVCDGPRASVTASVTIPDPVTATSSATSVCLGTSAPAVTLTAVQSGTNNAYNYSWNASPAPGSGMPTTMFGTSVNFVPTTAGIYTYSLTATDGPCTSISTVTVAVGDVPSIANASATPTAVCSGSTFTLNANSVIGGPQTIPTGYCTPSSSGSACITMVSFNTLSRVSACETGFYVNVPNTITTNVTPGQTYSLNLTTNSTAITSVWFDWNRDGVFSASEWLQPSTTGTTGVVTVSVPVSASLGLTKMRLRSRSSGNTNGSGDACSSFASGEAEDYTINVQFDQSSDYNWTWNPGSLSGNMVTTTATNTTTAAITEVYTVTATSTVTGCSNTATTSVVINPIPSTPVVTDGTQCGIGMPTASVSGGTSYNWYASPTSTVMIQSGSSATYTTSINSTTTWYVESTNGVCLSPRVSVTQTVTTPPVFTLNNPAAICAGSEVGTFSVTSNVSDYDTYIWNPTTNLYSDAAGTIAYAGSNSNPVYVKSTTPGVITINASATNSITGCSTVASTTISIKNAPTSITVSATPTLICAGNTVTLTAGANPLPVVLLNEGFNGTTNSWTKINNSTGGTASASAWTLRNSPYSSNVGTNITSNDASQFYLTDSDAQGSGGTTATILQSPAINTMGMSSLNLSFYHYYNYYSSDVSTHVEVSTNGTSWTSIKNYKTTALDIGTPTTFSLASFNLDSYVNQSTLYVRFNYNSSYGYGWAIDNVMINGLSTGVYDYSWTSTPTGFTSNTSTTTATPASTTDYSVVITNTATSCSNSGVVTVSVTPLPTVTVSASSMSVCAGSAATLTAGGATTYSWSSGGNTSTEVVTPSSASVYTVTGTDNGCSNTATVGVGVNTIPTVTATASNTLLCSNFGESAVLTAVTSATSYTWSDGANTMTTSVSPSVGTTYSVTVNDGTCNATSTIFVDAQICMGISGAALVSDINIYPNPTNGLLNVNVSSVLSGSTFIEVYDGLGKLALKENLTSDANTISLLKLEDGVYFFKIINNNETVKVGKVVKQ
ncbi:MAG: hypothetical protein K0R26_231 [Bacteroidota bacterium]|nr:hypothetical protein [Bacteroidota bacterium]